MTSTPIWQCLDTQKSKTNIESFRALVNQTCGLQLNSFADLHRWSVENKTLFWSLMWDFGHIVGEKGVPFISDADRILDVEFFPNASLNFAENLLRRRDNSDALVFWGEDQVKSRMSNSELYDNVSMMSQALSNIGVKAGDRVAAYMPNIPETVVAMLATASLGAIWSSCSPDFGSQGVLDRFGQIKPKVLIAADGYFYNGKEIDNLAKISQIVNELPALEKTIIVPYLRSSTGVMATMHDINKADTDKADTVKADMENAVLYSDCLDDFLPKKINFERTSFNHPLFIMFSSGTTGVPKCIVHGVGGTLIQHLKEHQLHNDVKADDRVFYFTTCTWMMWNWLISALASKAAVILYDGSPFYPNANILFDLCDAEKITHFGTSAKYIDTLINQKVHPKDTHDLSSIRVMNSTGSPLSSESYDFVYEKISSNLYLASIAGGTDIISCFALGNPAADVYRGEIACRGLGMAVEVWDENGKSINEKKGELVCVDAFPSMPLSFWNDKDNEKYKAAYFERYDNVWAQGDFAETTAIGGLIIHGRSDATLNPGGVRIGTAEIYRQVDQFDEVTASAAIGQQWDGDVRIVLFLVLAENVEMNAELEKAIRHQIRAGASPRHVPAIIAVVSDIPRTKSGKIAELAIRDIVEGKNIANADALANPESLGLFKNLEILH